MSYGFFYVKNSKYIFKQQNKRPIVGNRELGLLQIGRRTGDGGGEADEGIGV